MDAESPGSSRSAAAGFPSQLLRLFAGTENVPSSQVLSSRASYKGDDMAFGSGSDAVSGCEKNRSLDLGLCSLDINSFLDVTFKRSLKSVMTSLMLINSSHLWTSWKNWLALIYWMKIKVLAKETHHNSEESKSQETWKSERMTMIMFHWGVSSFYCPLLGSYLLFLLYHLSMQNPNL